jgi:acyl dehydratase
MTTLPEYRVRAVNTATEHENRIHRDDVAERYGFRGGLVPGVNVYGYLTVPVVRHFGPAWLENGWINVRFREPFYDGEEVTVSAEVRDDGWLFISANRASAEARLASEAASIPTAVPAAHPLPEVRGPATRELMYGGTPLGSFTEHLGETNARLVRALNDPTGCYRECAHPTVLLGLANEILVRNFELPAWIHTSSEVRNYRATSVGNPVEVRGVILETFLKKGHEFLRASVAILSQQGDLLTHITHTAIWQPRLVE